MKISEFRKLIKEEVRRVLKEAKGKAYALVIDEDGKFLMQDLMSYGEESDLNMEDPRKLSVNKIPNYPNTVDAWANAPELQGSQDAKWKAAVAKLGMAFDYYDVISDSGENAVIAAIPKGTNISDYDSSSMQDEPVQKQNPIQSHFSGYTKTLPSSFTTKKFANQVGITPEEAEDLLINKLRPSNNLNPQQVSKIMGDIVRGNYESFKDAIPKLKTAKPIMFKSQMRKY
jgi:hypothetical protein